MPRTQAFNLVDEAWVPIAGKGLASLREVFGTKDIGMLGGNPIQKIALLKFFQAIAQTARTPKSDADWAAMGPKGLSEACLAYLDKWHESFWLYGEKPFLQIPAIECAEKKSFGTQLLNIATGNTTIIFDSQREKPLSDAEKALMVIVLMGFGFCRKTRNNKVVLTEGYTDKKITGNPGTSLGKLGYQHHFLIGSSLLETIWLNMLTENDLIPLKVFPKGVGVPPWEKMPQGEDCETAKTLKKSLMGRLVPLSKFLLLAEDGIHYSDGILHADYKSGGFDPSVAIDTSGEEPKALWVDPEKQLWRHLPILLSFLDNSDGMDCLGIKTSIKRVRDHCQYFWLWAGGVSIHISSFGEQKTQKKDDFLESTLQLISDDMGQEWFSALACEMKKLDILSKILYATVMRYYEDLGIRRSGKAKVAKAKEAEAASSLFWQKCDKWAQHLVNACYMKTQMELRNKFAKYAQETYDSVCPRGTARQMEAWAANRPNTTKYLKQ